MKNTIFLCVLAIAVFLTGCQQQTSDNTVGSNGNSNAAAPEKDIKATLTEIENKAYEAWKNKDGKFFDGFLTEDFVEVSEAGRSNRAETIDQISESPCEVKSFSVSDENVLEIDENTALFYAKNEADFTCGDSPGPEKSYSATLFVKNGDTWKAAYHQSVISSEAKNPASAPPPASDVPKKEEPAADDHTKALSAIETALWDAFAKNEAKPFEDNLSAKFVNVTPDGNQDLAALKKLLADKTCEIKSHKLEDFKVTKVSDTVSILSYKASQEGKCGDAAVPASVWTASIYVKEGDAWKGVYHMETAVPPADKENPQDPVAESGV